MELAELMSWEVFVTWLTNPTAIPIVVGVLLSVAVEYLPWYTRLAPKWKRAVFFGLSLVVPVIGVVLGIATLSWPASWTMTFWPALMAGVLAFASGQLMHLRKLPDVPDDLPA